ncbi:hypothetical protein ERICI_03925 [Paenibacillus larvae subsp. larvae]|uniref:Uncharacterized protein n=1 Tax=Paenibacillus larvae subsp. larvae TaxID=147375 RepID=A0A6C0QM84_9BACL|nr:hypothetical protein ERICI_03925 [Paenibacillus larvae subsp. larvae]AVG13887.1 hypothetical protein ERICII_03592 [Paenibacillus larvae subsp. larvae DSM 25430]ETK29673.1 hypothetical protein ERIC1_1c32300 [Paenibacillus larvae subsp. larvae DSM 25719]QHZ49834.1 hypothetical protein ERICV_00649 [Paenibacillus larvae subsp. larvae]
MKKIKLKATLLLTMLVALEFFDNVPWEVKTFLQ